MKLIRVGIKLILLPLLCAVMFIKWTGTFLVHCSAWIFRILAVIFFLTAVLSGLMGLEDGLAVWQMLIGAFIIFMIPVVGESLVAIAAAASDSLIGVMRS